MTIAAVIVAGLSGRPVAAEEPKSPKSSSEPASWWDNVKSSLLEGEPELNLRLRAEIVEQDGLGTAQAYTSRLRLGYTTMPLYGLSLHADLEDIRTVDDDLYNAEGVHGSPNRAVVADPVDTELNQAFVKFENEFVASALGRQRITLDDHRFLGNVGWRQNEQTYDAWTIATRAIPDTELFYGYVDDVRRVFGPDADRDFRSDSHGFHASYGGLPCIGTLTGFGYLLDFDNSTFNSSDTFGVRLAGEHGFLDDFTASWLLSYAWQVDGADNPAEYEASYRLVQGGVAMESVGKIEVGYEVLGSDDGRFGFRTPLATLHAFNGWADAFLVTPAGGLEDLYVSAGTTLPGGVKARLVAHWFFSEDTSAQLGRELDAVASKSICSWLTLRGKLAIFDGNAGLADRQKFT